MRGERARRVRAQRVHAPIEIAGRRAVHLERAGRIINELHVVGLADEPADAGHERLVQFRERFEWEDVVARRDERFEGRGGVLLMELQEIAAT